MGFEAAPFDVVEASRRVWLQRWDPEAASGMAVFTGILRSYQLLSDQIQHVMRHHDLSFARYEVLTWLATDPDSALTLSWISKTLRIPPATVTNIIDRLEDEKLVRRVRHPSDARTTLAEITARGRRAAMDATSDLNEKVYEQIGLNERQRNQAGRDRSQEQTRPPVGVTDGHGPARLQVVVLSCHDRDDLRREVTRCR